MLLLSTSKVLTCYCRPVHANAGRRLRSSSNQVSFRSWNGDLTWCKIACHEVINVPTQLNEDDKWDCGDPRVESCGSENECAAAGSAHRGMAGGSNRKLRRLVQRLRGPGKRVDPVPHRLQSRTPKSALPGLPLRWQLLS